MATSSIFNNIQIENDASCRSFLDAIESSMKAKKKNTVIPSNVKVLSSKEEIRRLLNKNK